MALTRLEVYKFIFNITQENKKFELHTDLFDDFSFAELKDELEEILDFSKSSAEHLQDKLLRPRIFKAYKKLKSKKRRTNPFFLLMLDLNFENLKIFLDL